VHLEKATSRSSDAALAGWISSNDVTLFTMVLIVVVAVFLHNRLARGERQNSELADARQQLAVTLETTSGRLTEAEKALQQTQRDLQAATAEEAQLRQQLAEHEQQLAASRSARDQLASANDRLQTRERELVQTQQDLTADKAELMARHSALMADRDAQVAAGASLREELAEAGTKLTDATTTIAEMQDQRDRLKRQADDLEAIVAALREKLEASGGTLDEARQAAVLAQKTADEQISKLQSKAVASQRQADQYMAQLARAANELQALKQKSEQLENSLSKSEAERQKALLEEGRNNRELVGLKGSFQRVAILVDASGSMRQTGAAGGADRWAEAQRIVAVWLQHLNVRQCVLIVFSSEASVFPTDGSLVDLRGDDADAQRAALLDRLKEVSPAGYTNTFEALRKAYAYQVDSIVLFSDGAPSRSNSGAFDAQLAAQVYDLCARHPGIPVNTVGLGNYFDPQMATFLRTVAATTGGTFRGQ
jgi:colicin import membrane protein